MSNLDIFMKTTQKILAGLLLVICLGLVSCSSSRKSGCGCPSKKGMVGY